VGGDIGKVLNDVASGVSDLIEGHKDVINNVTDAVGITNHSGDKAAQEQREAADRANQTVKEIYDQQRADQEPWRQAGMTALSGLQENKFMDNWQQDPGYQFRMSEGMKAINGSAAARGMANSGATMKALTRYGQDFASSEYDKAYNRNYGRLSQLAGFGTGATAQNNQNAGQYGAQVAGNQIGVGNAAASNQIAQTNRLGQAIGQGASAAAAYFSDETLKTNINPISKEELKEMSSFLKAFAFNYKNSEHGEGDWIGVMAQDLEKSKLGKTLVVENEAGLKTISIPKVLSLFLATMAEA